MVQFFSGHGARLFSKGKNKGRPTVSIAADTDYATPGCGAHLRITDLEPAVGLRRALWTADHTHTHTRLTALCPGLPGKPVPES